MNAAGSNVSKEFFHLIKAIGEARSKQEEDRIVANEIATLKVKLNEPNISPQKMQELLIRSLYVELLGHDASFAHFHAVKMTNQTNNIKAKRLGYLACNLFLSEDNELMLLLINTIQKDLASPNILNVQSALHCVARLLTAEMLPALLPSLSSLLQHPHAAVRKKAVMAVHKVLDLKERQQERRAKLAASLKPARAALEDDDFDSEVMEGLREKMRRALCDADPSVMAVSLHVIHRLAAKNVAAWRDLVSSLVSILKQIIDRKLPKDYEYHRVPAPWIQIKILSLLSTLAAGDQRASEEVYELLQEVMRRADAAGVNVAYAVIYECVRTIAALYPYPKLLDVAGCSISRFISAENNNLRYVGVTGLAAVVQVSPAYATQHQLVVVDCLEDSDDTLKRKTLDLLVKITNPVNVAVIVEKLLGHLRATVDAHLRANLVQKIIMLAERYSPDPRWFLETILCVLEVSGPSLPLASSGANSGALRGLAGVSTAGNLAAGLCYSTAYSLLQLVAEGPTENEETDREFREYAVNDMVALLERKKLVIPDVLMQVVSWVLGEFGGYCHAGESVIDLLASCLERTYEDPTTQAWILSAILKLCVFYGRCALGSGAAVDARSSTEQGRSKARGLPAGLLHLLQKQQRQLATPPEVQERCFRGLLLLQLVPWQVLRDVFPFDASTEDVQVDRNLPFLNEPVAPSLNFAPYAPPRAPSTAVVGAHARGAAERVSPSTGLNGAGTAAGRGPDEAAEEKGGFQVQVGVEAGGRAFVPAATPQARPMTARELTAAALFSGTTSVPVSGVSSSRGLPLGNNPRSSSSAVSSVGSLSGLSKVGDRRGEEEEWRRMHATWGTSGGRGDTEERVGAGQRGASAADVSDASVDLLGLGSPRRASEAPNGDGGDAARLGGARKGEKRESPSLIDVLSIDFHAQDGAAGASNGERGGDKVQRTVASLLPLQTSTAEVGERWASLPGEASLSVPCVSASGVTRSCQEFLTNVLQQAIPLHVVEVIGDEAITAARTPLGGDGVVYVHLKVKDQVASFIIKASTPQ
ncbi:adaptin N terminal region domain-containing protein [Neospora caninum Liverpool]|uniref:Adaptin N terminal region domain-containing protein n=1 Tax=Neospora caninum (strain Liverpool) TaxID=572307 RepID=F0VEF3_NEOCL|nr:adaptin N terminal region domain-containing protein [Neospora caninum Liverpool]CBZ52097.1 adaptin N terminal region domain-containing protein [Neospora caninum Liverpool]|eukprot:XP_003882129.1 adaptin N terminal region domain-containing protein [Neospora caninum Liverpool]